MDTIFTKIIKGEIPSYKIAEDDNYYAFLDINPLAEGHTLVIPKYPTDYIFDMDDASLAGLIVFAKKIARALEQYISCKRIGMTVIGLEVPHTHIHLVPINKVHDIDFKKPALKLSPERFQEIATGVAKYLE
ncbi:MAG: HIT family protein [Bacteroidales bacterium]|jgi:histidine triad (HIT) family protein|nr:HIT family protein [Bacteroidales bacterium]